MGADTAAVQAEVAALTSQLKEAKEEADSANAEVKCLQKANYHLEDLLARQQMSESEATSTEQIQQLQAQLEAEADSRRRAEEELEQLKGQAAQGGVEGAREQASPDEELITELVAAKIAYATAEEEKGNLGLKLSQLRRALAKEREINQQVSQKMTRLEVKNAHLEAAM